MPPSKKSEDRVGILLECLRAAMPVNRACDFAQVHKDTFYEWYKSDPAFRLKVEYAKSHAIRSLIAGVAKKDPWKLLKNLDSENFKEHIEVNANPTSLLTVTTEDGKRDEFKQ